jgi:chromosome partitioning protein
MQRVLYPTTAAAGTTVLDAEPHGEAAKEIRALMQEIKEILHEVFE